MKLDQIKRIHCIGIGGIGISALARLYVHDGKVVSGTNDSESPQTLSALRKAGVPVSLDQEVLPDADLYVYSDAWLTLNSELIAKARATGKPTQSYFEALATVANQYYLIAIAGTHGKTTTTAMLIDVLEAGELDPSGVVGSLRTKTKSNYRAGKSKYFVAEADEYLKHFLFFTPDVLVITNIEHDHPDCYKNLAEIQDAFRELAHKVPEKGAVITDVTNPNIASMVKGLECTVIDYKNFVDLMLPMQQPGIHNRMNAAAAMAVADFLDISKDVRTTAIAEFAGTTRRFEYKGEVGGARVYDDYAHHPSAITAVIQGARELFPEKRVIAIFQPHTFSRTKALFTEFARALGHADHAIITPIYAAREALDKTVSSRELAVKTLEFAPGAEYIDTFEKVAERVQSVVTPDDVVLVLGAGDITKVSEQLVR